MVTKSGFNRKMQRAQGQQERNPTSQGAVPWDIGRGPGDDPLRLNSVLLESSTGAMDAGTTPQVPSCPKNILLPDTLGIPCSILSFKLG